MVLNVCIRNSEFLTENIFYVVEVEDFDCLQATRTWNVYRSYHHFFILRDILRKTYPFCILPPLPNNSIVGTSIKQRLRPSMLLLKGHDRRDAFPTRLSSTSVNRAEKIYNPLELFLGHILKHNRISESDVFLAFLCDDTKWLEIFEAVAHKLRRFANLMDTAEEESVNFMERCLLWQNYAKHSIAEMRSAYEKMQANLNAKYQQEKRQFATKQTVPDKEGRQGRINAVAYDRRFLENQICEVARTMAEESMTFENLHLAGAHDIFIEFTTVKLRQAERCHSIWMEILGLLQSTTPDVTASPSQS